MDERCIQGLERVDAAARGGVLTMGNFDGVHVGHQRILRAARALADREGTHVAAMTFEPPPGVVLHPDSAPQRISPPDRRIDRLLEAGADRVIVARTDAALLQLTAEEFIETIILARLAPRHVVEGRNFFFGHGRAGTIDLLRSAGEDAGFGVCVIDPVVLDFPEGGLEAEADRDKVEQILTNLVSNATKYSPNGGDIVIAGSANDTEVVLRVTDQGVGMTEEQIGQLFQRYQRVDRDSIKGIRGTGLGLYLVRGLVEAHAGRLWVTSEPGKGSSFFFALPWRRPGGGNSV